MPDWLDRLGVSEEGSRQGGTGKENSRAVEGVGTEPTCRRRAGRSWRRECADGVKERGPSRPRCAVRRRGPEAKRRPPWSAASRESTVPRPRTLAFAGSLARGRAGGPVPAAPELPRVGASPPLGPVPTYRRSPLRAILPVSARRDPHAAHGPPLDGVPSRATVSWARGARAGSIGRPAGPKLPCWE